VTDPGNENWLEARRLADVAHGRLVEQGRTVGVAESLTGGMVSMLLTEAPATSTTFRGGVIVYSTDLKHTLAGVSEEDLEKYGAVHSEIAEQLAAGVRNRCIADYGIATTGVAGPGEQDGRPVGEVHVAVAGPSGVKAEQHQFEGTRDEIRAAATAAALAAFVAVLDAEAS
jgi:nicotinamide-nucleotide amidase